MSPYSRAGAATFTNASTIRTETTTPSTASTTTAAASASVVDPRAAAFSGALSGALASVATHPLDVVRTKLAVQRVRSPHSSSPSSQSSPLQSTSPTSGTKLNSTSQASQQQHNHQARSSPVYHGTGGTLRRIFAEEGVRGLFRGITPAVASHAPAAAIFFSTYSLIRDGAPGDMLATVLPPSLVGGRSEELTRSSVGAGIAWAATCIVLNPLFVLKTKQQAQLVRAKRGAPLKYVGLLPSFRVVMAEQGIRGLYAGTLAAMASSPGAMLQMPLYEYLKRTTLPIFPPDENGKPSNQRVALASATSASLVGVIMYPMEVVRLRLQAQGPAFRSPSPTNKTDTSGSNPGIRGAARSVHSVQYYGIADCFRKILATEGVRALYRGLGTGLIRTVPQSAIGLSCYETMLRLTTGLLDLVDR